VESLVTYIISHELHLAFGGFRKPNSQLWLGCSIPWQGKKVLSMVLDSEIDFELLVAYFEVEKTKARINFLIYISNYFWFVSVS